jgi:DNA repair protein RadC
MSALPRPISLDPARPSPGSAGSVRVRLARLGSGRLDDVELLGLLIGSVPAARGVIDRLGGLARVAHAEIAELAPLPGVGQRRAAALVSGLELGRRAAAAWPDSTWRVRSPADVGEQMLPGMRGLEAEELRVLLLNTKNVVAAMRTVYVGNLAGSAVRVGEVFRDAVREQAAAIVVVHNHPSGDPTPSGDDLRITAELAEAGRLLDIELLDHIVIGRQSWVSLRSLGSVNG